jgi:hypothetical protein
MAIGLQNTENVDPVSSTYPFGKVRDDDGTGNGTPANTRTLGDFHQFFAKMMADAGITANGQPDNAYAGFQYIQALQKFISNWISIPSSTDLNDIKRPGLYTVTGSFSNRPSTTVTAAQLTVTYISDSDIRQLIIDRDTGAEWSRSFNGTSWASWLLIRHATKTIQIGPWDMDADDQKSIDLSDNGITRAKIIDVNVIIKSNTPSENMVPIDYAPTDAQAIALGEPAQAWLPAGNWQIFGDTIVLRRKDLNFFDDASSFGGTSDGRGFITFTLNP